LNKSHILDEIIRTAAANGGVPLGEARFASETGIKRKDWYGTHWARWSDAVREAGYEPNKLSVATAADVLLGQYARLALELGRLPADAELRMKRKSDANFPSWTTFAKLGSKAELVGQLRAFCELRTDFAAVVGLCEQYLAGSTPTDDGEEVAEDVTFGFVYLIRSGRYYKIGRSNSVGRREYELAIQLPERVETVHAIRTDDPPGIEEYWHRRFAVKRKNGEWFELDASDVAAFRRRKFM
jgi:hypothetical protein